MVHYAPVEVTWLGLNPANAFSPSERDERMPSFFSSRDPQTAEENYAKSWTSISLDLFKHRVNSEFLLHL
jgi:hypothetical protein